MSYNFEEKLSAMFYTKPIIYLGNKKALRINFGHGIVHVKEPILVVETLSDESKRVKAIIAMKSLVEQVPSLELSLDKNSCRELMLKLEQAMHGIESAQTSNENY